MKKLVYFILINAFWNSNVFAQEMVKGYIIKNNHEKIEGYLQETTDDELIRNVTFSTGLNDQKIMYTSSDLLAFGFSYGRTFESFILKPANDTGSAAISVFAKRILSGKVAMYTVQYDNNQLGYILKNNVTNKWEFLKHPVDQTITENGNTVVKRDLKYLQQLTAIKKDSEDAYVEQKDLNYSKWSILSNIKAYDLKDKEKYPVSYYVEKRAKLYGASYGLQLVNKKNINDAFRVNVFRDFMLIERSRRLAFHQGISYSQYKEYGKTENMVKIVNFSLLGLHLQADPMFACPFFNVSFGITYKDYPLYDYSWSQNSTVHTTSLRFSVQAEAGVRFHLASRFYLLGSCSVENSILCMNGGLAYYYSKKD